MMAMGESFVVICLESVFEMDQRRMLEEQFQATGKEIIAISWQQMNAFAGNMLQVRSINGQLILVMSTTAFEALAPEQIESLGRHTHLLHSPIHTIEQYGGGSARCMMAEIFLPLINP
jgi:hypothetical protein